VPAQEARVVAPEDEAPASRGAARPSGPRSKKELGSKLVAIARARPEAQVQLWCQDEARVGQEGRACHRWYERGIRPPGLAARRFHSLYLFAACRPGTDQAFALALPEATTASMGLFLERFAQELGPGVHAALVLGRAGWHVSRRLAVPDNITLVPLPPYSPELNPVERVWLYLRERFLSHRVLDGYTAVLDAAGRAWNALAAEPGRLASLTAYPYLLRSELR
jgi:hypothetical protein